MSFKNKLLQSSFVMEGLEKTEGEGETPTPDTEEVTVPPGGDAPAEGAADENTNTGEGDGTSDASADASLDGSAGGESADPADPAEGEDDEEPVETGPIDLVETDELNITQVAKEEAEAADEIEEQEVRRESIDDALGETTELVAAIEGLVETVRSGQALGPHMLRSMERQLSNVRTRVAFPSTKGFALEGLPAGNIAGTHVALEGFRNTLRAILDAIVNAIKQAVAWLTNYIKQRMVSVQKVTEDSKRLATDLLKLRNENEDKHVLYDALGFPSDFITLDGVTAHVFASVLKVDGQQPKRYDDAFIDVFQVVKMHEEYGAVFGKDLVQSIEDAFDAILKPDGDQGQKSLDSNFITHILPRTSMLADDQALRGVALPDKVKMPFRAFYNDQMLGNSEFWHFFNSLGKTTTLEDSLDALAGWTFMRRSTESKSADNGFLRRLTTNEIKAAAVCIAKLEETLANMAVTVDQLIKSNNDLKNIAQRATQVIAPLEGTEAFFNSNDPENGWKGGAITKIVAAISNVTNTVNQALYEQQKYGYTVCVAWNMYLFAMLNKEKAFLAANPAPAKGAKDGKGKK